MRAAVTIIGKDLRQRSRDGTLLLFAIAIPLGLAFLLDVLLGGDPQEEFNARYAVVDDGGGDLSSAFTDDMLGALEDDGLVELTDARSESEAREAVESGDVAAAFLIPDDFDTSDDPTITVVGDAAAPDEVQVAREVAEAFAAEHRRVELAVTAAVEQGAEDAGGGELAAEAAAADPAVAVVEDDEVRWRELDSATGYAAGAAVFFLVFATTPGMVSVFEERRNGTMTRLAAAPISTATVLLSKYASTVLVGLASMAIVAVASTALFGADWGAPGVVAALVVAVVLAVAGITAAVAAFAGSAEQATNWVTVVGMLLGLLGGTLFPVTQLGAFAPLSYLTPHRWFLDGLSDGTPAGAAVPIAVLLAIATAFGGLALLRMGRMLHR